MKITPFRGKLNFNNLPKPVPLTEYQLERRRNNIARRNGYQSYEQYLKNKHSKEFTTKFNNVIELFPKKIGL